MEDPGILIKDIIKSHIQKENELEKRIKELETELEKARNESDNSDYFLYKDILNYIIPNLRFEYEMNNEGIGGYNVSTSPIYTDSGYSVSLDHVKMPLNLINELLKEVEKYKQKYNIE
jgi:hypothetical protein